MISSIAINNSHEDKSLPPLLLPAVIHVEAPVQHKYDYGPSRTTVKSQGVIKCNEKNSNEYYKAESQCSRSPNSVSGQSVLEIAYPEHSYEQKLVSQQELEMNSPCKYKRQRAGPSCDICRVKKIKCDATIVVLYQDTTVLHLYNSQLHSKISVLELGTEILDQFPHDIRQCLESNELELLKHLDKLIAFKACTSCSKRKNCECLFSKGFTRADINVFMYLCAKVGNRSSIDQFNLDDYRKCFHLL